MNTPKLLIIVLAIVLACSIISVWFVPSSQDYMIGNTLWNGISNMLSQIGGQMVNDTATEAGQNPAATVIIIIPEKDFVASEYAYLGQFVNAGGTLIIADDFGFGNKLIALFKTDLRFNNLPLLDPLFCYKAPSLPKITDFSPEIVTQGIKQVLLNSPTVIDGADDNNVLAWSSPTSYVDLNQNGKQDANELPTKYPVAVKSQYGQGSVVLLSDPSLLINSMLTRYDNVKFVEALVNLLPYGEKKVLLDAATLPETSLDTSKRSLGEIKAYLAEPYTQLAALAVIFVLTSLTLGKVGGRIGRKS